MYLKSAEAVKKGHIVKDTGISTNLKTCQDRNFWVEKEDMSAVKSTYGSPTLL